MPNIVLILENILSSVKSSDKSSDKSSGPVKWFFEVDDKYESYFDKDSIKPYLFKRKINEGGYKKHRITAFNYISNKAYVQDFTKQKDTSVSFTNVQDMMSSFYFLRNTNTTNLKKGDEIALDMFMDSQIYPFKLRFLGREILKTKFGKVNSLIFRPLVQSGSGVQERGGGEGDGGAGRGWFSHGVTAGR